MHKAVLVVQILSTKLSILLGKTHRPLLYSIYCIGAYTVPKEIYFPRYNMKCSGENLILRGIFHVVSYYIAEIWITFLTVYVVRDNNEDRILACKVSKGPPKFDVNVAELYSYCRVPVVNTLSANKVNDYTENHFCTVFNFKLLFPLSFFFNCSKVFSV